MAPLTAVQVAAAAQQAGFTGDAIVMATAIAKRESGYDPAAVGDIDNPKPGHRSIGLMQINVGPSYNNAGIWFRENPDVLFDPVQNMKAAYEMSGGGTNWRPWSTYRAGIPAPDLEAVRAELAGANLSTVPIGATVGVGGGFTGTTGGGFPDLEALTTAAGKLTQWTTWRRVLQLGGGVVLVYIGANAIAGDALGLVGIPKPGKLVKAPRPTPQPDPGPIDTDPGTDTAGD